VGGNSLIVPKGADSWSYVTTIYKGTRLVGLLVRSSTLGSGFLGAACCSDGQCRLATDRRVKRR
jgi:hypothetical protein